MHCKRIIELDLIIFKLMYSSIPLSNNFKSFLLDSFPNPDKLNMNFTANIPKFK